MILQQLRQQINLVLCHCGCHRPVKPGNKFINGHNSRMLSDETRQRMSDGARMKVGDKSPNWKGGFSDSYRLAKKIRSIR
jgi:hypothetical protein